MKILSQDASAKLYEKAKSLGCERLDSWRCIYLNMSDRPAYFNDSLRRHFIVKALDELLEDVDGYVYVCEDGDIFILFQWALRPVLKRLGSHFDGLAPIEAGEQPSDSHFTIFDLSRYWQLFFELCQAKYLALAPHGGYFPYHRGAGSTAAKLPQD